MLGWREPLLPAEQGTKGKHSPVPAGRAAEEQDRSRWEHSSTGSSVGVPQLCGKHPFGELLLPKKGQAAGCGISTSMGVTAVLGRSLLGAGIPDPFV